MCSPPITVTVCGNSQVTSAPTGEICTGIPSAVTITGAGMLTSTVWVSEVGVISHAGVHSSGDFGLCRSALSHSSVADSMEMAGRGSPGRGGGTA